MGCLFCGVWCVLYVVIGVLRVMRCVVVVVVACCGLGAVFCGVCWLLVAFFG